MRFDRDAKTSPVRLAILLGIGLILVLLLWYSLRDGDDSAAPQPISPPTPVSPNPAPAASDPTPPPASGSVSQLTLHGVMGVGSNGAAIIDIAGQGQRYVRTGRDIIPGITLVAVAANSVLLSDRGSEVQLRFREAGMATGATTAEAPPRPSRSSPEALAIQAALEPHDEDGRHVGYRLRSGSIPATLSAAGLEPGDVILRVGGTTLESPDDIDRIPRELRASDSTRIDFVRDGQRRSVSTPGS